MRSCIDKKVLFLKRNIQYNTYITPDTLDTGLILALIRPIYYSVSGIVI